ncbi:MAG: hypothetical protein JAY90_18665 [Candidatus Thiodiazotropha lotti]|nr:hypothetical protein [Candidatus Thiodiazotropha lotti]
MKDTTDKQNEQGKQDKEVEMLMQEKLKSLDQNTFDYIMDQWAEGHDLDHIADTFICSGIAMYAMCIAHGEKFCSCDINPMKEH